MKNKKSRTFVKTTFQYGLIAVAVTAFIGAMIWLSFASPATRKAVAAPLPMPTPGTVVAWGVGLTDTSTNFELNPEFGQSVVPADLSNVIAIAGGGYHTVALKSDGAVTAWGWNGYGQTNVPPGLTGVKAISAGLYHTVALKNDGTVVAWGATTGDCFPNCGQSMVPAGLSGVTAISAGRVHTLALKSDGTVVAWGGVGYDFHQADVPAGLTNVIAIAAGEYHSLAVKNDGTVVAWGNNWYLQTDVPTDLSGVTAVAGGYGFSAALKSDGTVVVWGGNGTLTNVPAGVSDVKAIAANHDNMLVLKGDGSVVAWGGNSYGLTDLTTGLPAFKAIAAGYYHNIGLTGTFGPTYNFAGFFQPVNNIDTLNVATAGSAIPIKFSLGGDQGMAIFMAAYPASGEILCDQNEPGADIQETVTAGGSSLQYDASADQYSYIWKTNKAWKGKCRILVVKLADGSNHLAKFRFK